MPPFVELCRANADAETRARLNDIDASLTVHPCLEQCGICYTEPFLVVDGDLNTGSDHGAIVDRCIEE